MLVRIGDAFVVFLAILVFVSVRIRIAAAPELFDKSLSFIIGFQLLERLAFFVGDDVGDVLIQPILVGLLQLSLFLARLVHRILILRRLGVLGQARRDRKNEDQERYRQTAYSA